MLRLVYLLPSLLAQSSKDLLFINSDNILELPSFNKSSCNVESFPLDSRFYEVVGLVNDSLVACNNDGCKSLSAGKWGDFPNMTFKRAWASASNSSSGLFVTGGGDASNNRMVNTTEVFDISENRWRAGPELPTTLIEHCQLQVGDTVFVMGKAYFNNLN